MVDKMSNLTIKELIDERAMQNPEASFLIDPQSGTNVNFRQTQRIAQSVAAKVAQLGAEPGQAVAYAMRNDVTTALVILGLFYGGYHATAINLVSGEDTIQYVLDHSKARLVLTDQHADRLILAALSNASARPDIVCVDADWLSLEQGAEVAGVNPGPASDGILMYTSGTTGRPKGVVLSHRNLLAGAANVCQAHQLRANDRAYCTLPLYHINGLCVTLLGPLLSGGSVVMPAKFGVSRFWHDAAAHEATWLSLVPTQISFLVEAAQTKPDTVVDCHKIRFARSASAALSPDVQSTFETRFSIPIVETMGLTETAAQILSNPLPPGKRKPGSAGQAIGNEVIIADPTGKEVPDGREGEILVRGANVMREYLRNDQATLEALSEAGWLRTGDLGHMDEEGYVFVHGRLKELIIKGGENISPREIDEALYSHPDVVEAAAFSLPCPHYGEKIAAAVAICDGSSLGTADLIALCIKRLGSFKAPETIHVFDELPKGPSGKIQRRKLSEYFDEEAKAS